MAENNSSSMQGNASSQGSGGSSGGMGLSGFDALLDIPNSGIDSYEDIFPRGGGAGGSSMGSSSFGDGAGGSSMGGGSQGGSGDQPYGGNPWAGWDPVEDGNPFSEGDNSSGAASGSNFSGGASTSTGGGAAMGDNSSGPASSSSSYDSFPTGEEGAIGNDSGYFVSDGNGNWYVSQDDKVDENDTALPGGNPFEGVGESIPSGEGGATSGSNSSVGASTSAGEQASMGDDAPEMASGSSSFDSLPSGEEGVIGNDSGYFVSDNNGNWYVSQDDKVDENDLPIEGGNPFEGVSNPASDGGEMAM